MRLRRVKDKELNKVVYRIYAETAHDRRRLRLMIQELPDLGADIRDYPRYVAIPSWHYDTPSLLARLKFLWDSVKRLFKRKRD